MQQSAYEELLKRHNHKTSYSVLSVQLVDATWQFDLIEKFY